VRCARCNHDSTYPQRTARLCPGCKQPFAFEPRAGDPFSDMAWKQAIAQVSSDGSVRFVTSNLHHEMARRQKPSKAGYLVAAATAVGSCVAAASLGLGLIAVGAVGAAVIGYGTWRDGRGLRLPRAEFDVLLGRWIATHGAPPGLIRLARPEPPGRSAELDSELEAYSFDRAVICDRRDVVDLLLANDFHFENNCAVLSVDGHPRHAFDIVRKMLRGNPRLDVFVLHDATPTGCTLAHYLRTDPDWFGGTPARVVDVALRPAQGQRMLRSAWRHADPVPTDLTLDAAERAWLARWRVELTAIRPEQLVKRLFRTMQLVPAAVAAEGDVGWTIDATVSDGGGGDGFG
jgi:hypothetical protein